MLCAAGYVIFFVGGSYAQGHGFPHGSAHDGHRVDPSSLNGNLPISAETRLCVAFRPPGEAVQLDAAGNGHHRARVLIAYDTALRAEYTPLG